MINEDYEGAIADKEKEITLKVNVTTPEGGGNMSNYEGSISYAKAGNAVVVLPSALARALKARDYNRVQIIIAPEGLLLVPFKGKRRKDEVLLPEWGTGE